MVCGPDRGRIHPGAAGSRPRRAVGSVREGDGADGIVNGHLNDGHRPRLLSGGLGRHRGERLSYRDPVPLAHRILRGCFLSGHQEREEQPEGEDVSVVQHWTSRNFPDS